MPLIYVYDDVAVYSAGASCSAMTSEDTTNAPRSNIVLPTRYRQARTTVSPAGTVDFDIDLGSAKAISGFGIHYLTSEAAAGSHPTVDVMSSASSFASAASRVAAPQTAAFWNTSRDWVNTFPAAATFTHRYWRIRCASVTARFGIGHVMLGTGIDLSYLFKSGEFEWEEPSEEVLDIDEHPIDMPFGEARRHYRFTYLLKQATDLPVIERLAQQRLPFGIVDPSGRSTHVRLTAPKKNSFPFVFGDVWNGQIALSQLP